MLTSSDWFRCVAHSTNHVTVVECYDPFFMPFFSSSSYDLFFLFCNNNTQFDIHTQKKNLTTIVRYDFLQKIFFVKLSVNGETGLLALLIIVVHQLCYTRPHCSYIELLSLLSRSNWWRSASTVCVAVKAASATWNRHWSMLFVPLSSKALKSMDLALIFTR